MNSCTHCIAGRRTNISQHGEKRVVLHQYSFNNPQDLPRQGEETCGEGYLPNLCRVICPQNPVPDTTRVKNNVIVTGIN